MIIYHTYDVKLPTFPKRKISAWIKSIAAKYDKKIGDIAYIFCSDEKILEINKTYLSHNYYTDIITFDYSKERVISGDLFISIETVHTNAEKFATPYENELNRVMIHGILHLCGICDKCPKARSVMEDSENEALDDLFNK